MKRILIIFLISCTFPANLEAEEIDLDSIVSISFEEITLKEALNELTEKYNIRFSYSDSKIPVNDTLNVDFTSIRLGTAFKYIFHENDINFNIIGNQIVLFPFNSNQTITIKGIVTDQSDGSPVPFANISLSGTSRGTSTNEEGEFQLSLNKLPSELLISHLIYEKKLVYAYDDYEELHVQLLPSQTMLQEITIRAKRNGKSAYQVVKRAYDQLSKSSNDIKFGKAFYRQKSRRENKYTEIFELFYDIKYSPNGIEDWAVQEGRYAFQTKEEYDIFLYNKNFTLLSRLFPIQQPVTDSYIIPLNKEVKKHFDLDLKDIIKFDERLIAVISYQPKSESATPIASGELYIDLDNYQVLKMKGTISDESLDIIGFGDDKSNWENYQLDFQVSFIDNQSGELLMDFIQIDHHFDFYFKNEKIGKIATSSLLTFYEHYTPAKNKKLGGPINYRKSDMDVIDGVGYNSAFWARNPIIKRTPLEEKLIQDFEQNEAFGAVFLNNQDEVILLPDKNNSENAKLVISKFESKNRLSSNQRLFLRLDKENYLMDDVLHFSAYILDRWQLKPYVLGSVLFVELVDNNNQIVINRKFDILGGMSYGEINLSEINKTGLYHIKAFTNSDNKHVFQKGISITQHPTQLRRNTIPFNDTVDQLTKINFYPESGTLLNNINSKIVFIAIGNDNSYIQANWEVIGEQGEVIQHVSTNQLGIGSFDISPVENVNYTLRARNTNYTWQVPQGNNKGFSMKIKSNNIKSIQVEFYMKPALPKNIYILSSASGKVFSFFEKQLQASKTKIDLPLTHLPEGKNNIVVLDRAGNVLASRSFFVQPSELDINLESAAWKSKRSNRVLLKLKISDQNGIPAKANLTAICSSNTINCYEYCDIGNYLLFGAHPALSQIDLSLRNDSIYGLIDQILITQSTLDGGTDSTFDVQYDDGVLSMINENILAELNVTSNYSSSQSTKIHKKRSQQKPTKNEQNKIYWIPFINTDEHGTALIEYKLESKNKPFYINIQGVSHYGQIGKEVIVLNPFSINSMRRPEKRKKTLLSQ